MLGSGAMIVLNDSTCMVDVALRAALFFVRESCGECTTCRIGTKRIVQLLAKIGQGNGSWHDIAMLRELGERMQNDARCGLGQAAPLPFLTSLLHFKDEYKAHIEEKECTVGVCGASTMAVPHYTEEVSV